MSIQYMSAVWNLELPSALKFVFVAIADCANQLGECFPSVNFLVKKTGYKKRHVQKCINELVNLKYLQKHSQKRKNGSFTSNKYKILSEILGIKIPKKVVSCEHPPGVLGTPHITINDPFKENKQKKVKRAWNKSPGHISKWLTRKSTSPRNTIPEKTIPDDIAIEINNLTQQIDELKNAVPADVESTIHFKLFPPHVKEMLISHKKMHTRQQLNDQIVIKQKQIHELNLKYRS